MIYMSTLFLGGVRSGCIHNASGMSLVSMLTRVVQFVSCKSPVWSLEDVLERFRCARAHGTSAAHALVAGN
jgi:hypothetical protein